MNLSARLHQGHIKLIKGDSEDIIMVQNTLFQINAVILNFLFITESCY